MRGTHFRAAAPGDTFSDAGKAAYLRASDAVVHGLDSGYDTGPPMSGRVVKCHRVATQDWILGVDHQLQTLTGKGLAAFEPKMVDVVPMEKQIFGSVFGQGLGRILRNLVLVVPPLAACHAVLRSYAHPIPGLGHVDVRDGDQTFNDAQEHPPQLHVWPLRRRKLVLSASRIGKGIEGNVAS